MKKKVLIVDDHKLFRKGLRLLIETLDSYEVVDEASNGHEFLAYLDQELPDLVLLDIAMPEMDGLQAALIALHKHPDLKIITLSMYVDQDYYFNMVDAGVKGFLLKNSDLNEVRQTMDCVTNGGNFFSSELLINLVNALKNSSTEISSGSFLTEREKEVILLICRGYSTQEIADHLFLSKRTIDTHRANILAKTNCKNTASLVVYAIQNKFLEI